MKKTADPFISELIHEIRSPLTGLSVMLDSIHDRLSDRPDERELIVKALSEVERLENLLTEYLTDTITYPSGFFAGRVENVIGDILLISRKLCEKQNIRLIKDLNETDMRMLNTPKLKQAFINIINNAIEAMPDGGELTVSVTEDGHTAVVSVKDTGAGIDEKDLPKIFDQGYTSKQGGTGIGLFSAKKILDAHGAETVVRSEKNKGTEFIIKFPQI
ncbi:MAG: sensor histidine kinase [Deferribacterales bacterium]